MVLYVLDNNFNRIGLVEGYKSFIWTKRYFTPGDFELYIPATPEAVSMFVRDNMIMRSDDLAHAMIIERVKVDTDEENGNTSLVSGRCLKSIIHRRIVWSQTILDTSVRIGIMKLLNENLISPSIAARTIENFEEGDISPGTNHVSAQFTGDNLGDAVEGILRNNNLGYDVTVDLPTKKMYFSILEGEDRSYDQSDNSYVVFSPEFENLVSTTYTEDATEYHNVARVGGEGEGSARKFVTAGDTEVSGMDRYEMFCDQRSLSTNNGEISEADYATQLTEAGKKDLSECEVTVSYEGSVLASRNYELGVDYNLGDVVEVINEFGMEGKSRVTEVIECLDESGRHVVPTFEAVIKETAYWCNDEEDIFSDEDGRMYVFK